MEIFQCLFMLNGINILDLFEHFALESQMELEVILIKYILVLNRIENSNLGYIQEVHN